MNYSVKYEVIFEGHKTKVKLGSPRTIV